MSNHLKIRYMIGMIVLDVTPDSANWQYLSFRIVKLESQQVYLHQTAQTELALFRWKALGRKDERGRFP